MREPIRIDFKRRLTLAATALFGIVAVGGINRGIHSHSVFAVTMGVIVAGLPCVYYAMLAFRRRPYVSIDDERLIVDRRGVGVPWRRLVVLWNNVFEAEMEQRQGIFGVSHDLVLSVRREDKARDEAASELQTSRVPTETVSFSLDMLTMPWGDIVTLVQKRLGKPIAVKQEAGLFGKTRTSS
jgi:hypothetical protein